MYKFRLTYDEWKSMVKKERKGAFCHSNDFNGYVGLLEAKEVSDRQIWDYKGSSITVLDNNYKWLTILPKDDYYCITVMMNENYEIQVTYIDMIDGQGIDEDGVPYCYDCYLDLVVYTDGYIKVDDRDELDEAYANKEITKKQYQRALDTADKLCNGLLKDYSKYEAFVKRALTYAQETTEKMWIFFDLGSTLVDETKVYEKRWSILAREAGVSFEQVKEECLSFYKENKKGDLEVARKYGLEIPEWTCEDERLYPETKEVLSKLKEKYHLGVIANQKYGTVDRLRNFGILDYMDVVVASAEEGVEKPSREIFDRAIQRAGTTYSQAIMVGDRIDNDIIPAKALGMKTIWIKQGFGRFWKIKAEEEKPHYEIQNLNELLKILLYT